MPPSLANSITAQQLCVTISKQTTSGTVAGQQSSQSMQMPAGHQISLTKIAEGVDQLSEAVGTFRVTTTFQRQSNGSYQAPTVVAAELASLLPPGVNDSGMATFWVNGDTLFGDTREVVTGPNTKLSVMKSWRAACSEHVRCSVQPQRADCYQSGHNESRGKHAWRWSVHLSSTLISNRK